MNIATIVGTRPEIIRLSIIMDKLNDLCSHTIINTRQNNQSYMNDTFWKQFNLEPTYEINQSDNFIGSLFSEIPKLLQQKRVQKVLILGDTNSALSAIIAEKMGIPVYHMEAGNRCFNKIVPEEINRKIIDSISTYNLPYTERARENLLREGIAPNKVFVVGNPIFEVIEKYSSQADNKFNNLDYKKGEYILCTFHRAENVDNYDSLKNIIVMLNMLAHYYKIPIIVSAHPRFKDKLNESGLTLQPRLELHDPFDFVTFLGLEKNAKLIITDSGTVSEEAAILDVPCIVYREQTERIELLESGHNVLAKMTDSYNFINLIDNICSHKKYCKLPKEYEDSDVSDKVINLLLGDLR